MLTPGVRPRGHVFHELALGAGAFILGGMYAGMGLSQGRLVPLLCGSFGVVFLLLIAPGVLADVSGWGRIRQFWDRLPFGIYLAIGLGTAEAVVAAGHWLGSTALVLCAPLLGMSAGIALRLTRPLTALRNAMRRIGEGDFAVRLPGRTADEIGQLERAVNAAAGALQQRERLRELFGKYLSRQIAERVLNRPTVEVMAGEQKEVSILFADVRGFTTFSERHSPTEVVAALNEYFGIVVEVIAAHEGVLDKFIGDGLMAVFGAPMEQADHARRAVTTALEMQAAVRALNARRVERGEEPIAVGIGVNTGLAVSGDLGAPSRVEYTVVGDSVNLASRLEHQAARGEVLVGSETYARVQDVALCEPLGAFPIKGKQEMVQVYRVVGLRSSGPA